MNRLAGKVALVTGSSRGIGAAVAARFAEEGARVAVHGRDTVAVERVRSQIAAKGGDVIAVLGDVTKFPDIEANRGQIEERWGPVSIVVANAGGNAVPPGPLEEISEAGWHAVVDGNLTATFLTLKSYLPGMKARRSGTIITLSSAAARRAHPGSPIAYAAAKAGIQLLTQDVAAQVGPFGIRVNAIAPETILTERNREWIPEEKQRELAHAHPIRRLGTPADVAAAAVFFASDESSWISGVVLDVAGGAVLS